MQYKGKICNIFLLFLVTQYAVAASASPLIMPGDKEEQRQRARQEAQQRQERQEQQDVFLRQQARDETEGLPKEAIQFRIQEITLEGKDCRSFPFVKRYLKQYEGREIGQQAIQEIIRRANDLLITKGYVTTRILIQEQDLTTGKLRLFLSAGRIQSIRFADPALKANWRTAFPTRPGNILNIRHLEQGLEQLKRIASREVDFKIVPAEQQAKSDIIIEAKQNNPLRLTVGVDDSGSKATGKIQFSANIAADNLFNANDILRIGINHDGEQAGQIYGTRGHYVSYSIPYGDWIYSIGQNSNKYHQTVDAGFDQFVFSGQSETYQISAEKLLNRTQTSKTHLEFGIALKESHNYVDDIEITMQERKTTTFNIGVRQRRYLGQAVIDWGVSSKHGVPWMGAQSDPAEEIAELPTLRYHLWNIDFMYRTPVDIGGQEAQYRLSLSGQYTRDKLYAAECLSIGNRYTVRGFDGEQTLMGDSGAYVQNELSFPLKKLGQEIFVGLDWGRVSGYNTDAMNGKTLIGSVVGLRGNLGKCSQYEVFVGWALKKPEGMQVGKPVYGFQYIGQI